MGDDALKKRLKREVQKNKILEQIIEDNTRELYFAERRAKEESLIKVDFLSKMSHELRTPLNGVIGITSLLMQDEEINDKQMHFLKLLEQSANGLLLLVNDILDYSKIKAQKLKVRTESFDLEKLLSEVFSSMALMAEDKNLEMYLDYNISTPTWILSDPGKIRQILINLIGNALKFTRKGSICLDVKTIEEDGEPFVKFSVIDSGMGVPVDSRSELFRDFSQIETSERKKIEGTGLGLSICKQLSELMDGSVGFEENPQGGSIFWFTIPLVVDEEKDHDFILSSDLKNKRVLFCTKLRCYRHFVDAMSQAGLICTHVNLGSEAIAELTNKANDNLPYDFLVMIYDYPDIDALSIGKLVSDDPQLKDTLMVYIGSSKDSRNEAEIKSTGFSGVYFMPLPSTGLLRALDSVWSEHRQQLDSERNDHRQVLIVEDDYHDQKVIQTMLNELNCHTDIVDSGAKAIDRLTEKAYDLVLLDLKIPEPNGVEVTKQIRNNAEANGSQSPIIILSAQAFESTKEECLKSGADLFLTKPVDINTLSKAVNSVIKKPS